MWAKLLLSYEMEFEWNFQLFVWRNIFCLIIGVTFDSMASGHNYSCNLACTWSLEHHKTKNWEQGCFMISTECAKMQQYIILEVVEKFLLASHIHNGQLQNWIYTNTNILFVRNIQRNKCNFFINWVLQPIYCQQTGITFLCFWLGVIFRWITSTRNVLRGYFSLVIWGII